MSDLTALYVHVPFCVKKCAYCDFYSVADLSVMEDFVTALLKEIVLRNDPSSSVDTIYFGGGTPSLLLPGQIARILGAFGDNFTVCDDCEVTMEVNPGTVDLKYLKEVRHSGINRLNLGVQSFSNDRLHFMGRIHSAEAAQNALVQARDAGFDNIGFDLIYGLPGDCSDGWIKELDTALGFIPEHISCYMLSYEPATPIYGLVETGAIVPLDDGAVAELFRLTSNHLCSHGYLHYEISNFAIDASHQSRHNQKYWNHAPYLGFGPSAHSFEQGVRSWNHRDVNLYIKELDGKKLPAAGAETLTKELIMMEMVMLGFRRSMGVDLLRFEEMTGHNFIETFKTAIIKCGSNSWGRIADRRFVLTLEGRLFLDTIIAAFVDLIPDQ